MSSNGFQNLNPNIAYTGNGSAGVTTVANTNVHTSDFTFTAYDFKLHDGSSLVDRIIAIEERLAILSNPSPEKIEQFQSLKEAYDQYKFLETLLK